jgi:hypothetical protein
MPMSIWVKCQALRPTIADYDPLECRGKFVSSPLDPRSEPLGKKTCIWVHIQVTRDALSRARVIFMTLRNTNSSRILQCWSVR